MGEQVQLERAQKLHGVLVRVRQDLLDLPQPFIQLAVIRLACLVFPVSRVSPFGYLVHAVGTDLHLDPLSVGRHDCHMQRFVAVRLGRRDPIAYTLGMRAVELRDGGIDHPALVFLAERVFGREDDTHRQQVIYVFERTLLPHHLLPYRINGFDARHEGKLITHTRQALADRF